jgi:hypothetical protein
MRNLIFFIFLIASLAVNSCQKPPNNKDGSFAYGRICDGKTILAYTDREHLQNEHKFLYQDYINGQEEESVLENFETAKTHYSLRKRDNDMDDGTIPDDPNFESFDYTTDDILESILNQDGMVIINNELYLWDDGCAIYKTKFSCKNYQALLDLRDNLKAHALAPTPKLQEDIAKLRTNFKISEIDKCTDARYDFETISEDDLVFESDTIPFVDARSLGCGYKAFIYAELLSNNATMKKARLRISSSAIQPPGANPTFAFYLPNVTANNQVKLITGSIPNYVTNSDWFTGLSADGEGIVYPGEWMEIEVDYSLINQLEVNLRSVVTPFSGNSCISKDQTIIDLNCLVYIAKKTLNASAGMWQFDIQGVTISSNQPVIWNFGDGKPVQVTIGQTSTVYSYDVPCSQQSYSVVATIEGDAGCRNPITVGDVLVGDPCKMDKRRQVQKFKLSGKNVKLVIKIRNKYFSGGTSSVLKNKFRWRVNGEKAIETKGLIYANVGNNCISMDLSTKFSPNKVTKTSKSKLVQKLDDGSKYAFDLNQPYEVIFSHANSSFTDKQMFFTVSCSN